MINLSKKQSGISIQSKYPVRTISKAVTAAQAMTKIAYNDTSGCLQFRVGCDDYWDMVACIKIIGSYNKFDSENINHSAFWHLNVAQFYNDNNPNNGSNLFKFEIGREYSPVIYVTYNATYGNRKINDVASLANDETELFWEEYGHNDFYKAMENFAREIGCDEFSVINLFPTSSVRVYQARFWFD